MDYFIKLANGIAEENRNIDDGINLDLYYDYNELKFKSERMQEKYINSWIEKYTLACAYYEHHNNLDIPSKFKTINGYEYDEDGVSLGSWLSHQKEAFYGIDGKTISIERIELLKKIGMNFTDSYAEIEWNKKYNLAVSYYNYYGNLDIPSKFKTINGYEYDEDGVSLGSWLSHQKEAFYGIDGKTMPIERIELLKQIGMCFEKKKNKIRSTFSKREKRWNKKYNLATSYYNHYGNLEISQKFKTKDGYTYDEDGINLGYWIVRQRQAYQGKGTRKITKEQIELLRQIGMCFEKKEKIEKSKPCKLKDSWKEKYNLAVSYYNHYGNLKVPKQFKTKDGYTYDELGIRLGRWIYNQKAAYQGKGECKITEEQIELLDKIGMNFIDSYAEIEWNKKYNLAVSYYNYYGNLDIPSKFKTINGYEYDEDGINLGHWIYDQRIAYHGVEHHKISLEQIELLNRIGMRWSSDKIDDKFQKEEITEENKLRKEREIYNRFVEYLLTYNLDTSVTNEEINNNFIKKLNRERR